MTLHPERSRRSGAVIAAGAIVGGLGALTALVGVAFVSFGSSYGNKGATPAEVGMILGGTAVAGAGVFIAVGLSHRDNAAPPQTLTPIAKMLAPFAGGLSF